MNKRFHIKLSARQKLNKYGRDRLNRATKTIITHKVGG